MTDATEHLFTESENSKDAIPRVKLVQKFETGLKIKQIVFLESALSYLLFTETGEVYFIENGQENVRKLEGRCSPNQLRALYASSRHSLVLQNGDKLLVRRDQNGVFLLQKAFVENVIEGGNASIEVPVHEIFEWQKFFSTEVGRNGVNECTELRKLEEIMKNTMQEYHANGLQTLTAILVIPKIHEFLPNLESATFKVLKLKCNVYPVFPLVFWLIERIRWILDREKPYHLLGNKNNKGRAIDISLMNIEAARVLSFYKWPHMSYKYALPYRMAETGFFFQPNINGDDRVVCFSCLISLVLWEPNDEPLQEHERHHTSRCAFNEDSCNDNVPLDVTTACQPFASIPFDNESVVIASTMNASAELFAVADASNNSVVRMFHLDSCPLQPFILQFDFIRDLKFTAPEKMEGESNNENCNQISRITALSVAGRERFMTIDGDTDAVAQLYIGTSMERKLFEELTPSSNPFIFVYKVSRHLKEKTDIPQPPKPLPPAPPLSITDMFSDVDGEASSSSVLLDHDDDVIDVDFWSPDDMMDDNFDPVAFKNKIQKKNRVRHDEQNSTAEIDYNPFKLKYTYLGLIELNFEPGQDWIINNITVSDVDNGLVAVSAYSKEQNKSAIAHFARRSDCHRIADSAIKYQYFNDEVRKLIVLPVDHFASFRVSNFANSEPYGPNVILGNTLMVCDHFTLNFYKNTVENRLPFNNLFLNFDTIYV
uniref:Uncharacterized protein n=1 Tax=Panagrolaimus superbus TaxID=310955 RepID=A0A914YEH1_9BILA